MTTAPRLLLIDLDNTLLDRAGAFQAWATGYLRLLGAPPIDVDWLVSVDADGLTSPWDTAQAMKERYTLSETVIDLKEAVQTGLLDYTRADPLIACALRIAADAGWVPVIVTDGETETQEEKIRRAGLASHVADWVIAEEAGVSKPNRRIFEIAARRGRCRLSDAWVVGDGPETDIRGAAELDLPSVWLHRRRSWTQRRYEPTRSVDSVIAAVAAILESARPAAPMPHVPRQRTPLRNPTGSIMRSPAGAPRPRWS